MRVATLRSSEFNIVSKGIHLRAQVGVLFQIPGRIKERMRIATFAAPEVEVMQEGIEFEAAISPCCARYHFASKRGCGLRCAGSPIANNAQEGLAPLASGFWSRYQLVSNKGCGSRPSLRAVLEIMRQWIQASAGDVRILSKVPNRAKQRAGIPALPSLPIRNSVPEGSTPGRQHRDSSPGTR